VRFPTVRLALCGLVGVPLLAVAARAEDSTPPPVEQVAPSSSTAALPLAPAVKGERPRLNPTLVPPAATELAPGVGDLPAPASLALPTKPEQVRIRELRPISLVEAENLAEVNNPELKAVASQVDQAQSNLRAQIALWYPSLDLQAFTTGQIKQGNRTSLIDRWDFAASLNAQWALINPQRVPTVAAARDQFESARFQYVIALRDLRLQVAQAYFRLQQADDGVRIGQESVRASLVSLRDARARFQAGVATKLEVLEAETQLARDQQLLAEYLAAQSVARRSVAALLDLPQTVTPTAKDPSRVLGVWQPSLPQSIVAAYTFREELDQSLLDISIANSNANSALANVQPFLNVFTAFGYTNYSGAEQGFTALGSDSGSGYDTVVGLNFSWNLFDGGRSRAQYRQQKQAAQENTYRFAQRRDDIRRQVEESFYELEKNNRNIITTSREVISARESLRLARLRFQAGVTTQREVVDNQRDLTQAEVRYSNAITDYNIRLAELRRRTGLDQVVACSPHSLPAAKPTDSSAIPVEPTPLIPACQAAAPGAV
jgi:OMF family outer membrane factor